MNVLLSDRRASVGCMLAAADVFYNAQHEKGRTVTTG